ncbi:MAG: IS21-like element helper ATPase IstB [Betaproteobacteria bacterium]|nr:IS21-like element helper ATPase IstB [Betaproteobacteria bacterium]
MNYTRAENRHSIEATMRTLKLSGLAKEWRNVEYQDPEQYMRELLEIEVREREANRMTRMIKQAGFRVMKTLDSFVWKPGIEIPNTITREEMEAAAFVSEKENLVLMGAVGTGKTHLATAIALNLCQQGRHVRFYTATGLANILQERHQRGTLTSFMSSLRRVELLVLDEIGFITLHKEASELLFQVVSECYEQKSLIITSNLEFGHWNTVFGDNKLTNALVDRLIHHSHIVVFSGPGHRLEESMQRQRRGGTGQ